MDSSKKLGAANGLLVSESYEIVFNEPTQLMQHFLLNVQPLTSGPYSHDTDFEAKIKKVKSLEHILEVKQAVNSEVQELKDKLKLAKFKAELAKVQKPPAT